MRGWGAKKMVPKGFREPHDLLQQDVISLHSDWKIFLQLYGQSEERVELLAEVAPHFFATVQEALVHNIYLGVTRLTDPASQGSNKNLSLYRLAQLVEENGDSELAARLQRRLEDLSLNVDPLRVFRNWRLAHNDLPIALGEKELPVIHRSQVEQVLAGIRGLMNEVSGFYGEGKTLFQRLST